MRKVLLSVPIELLPELEDGILFSPDSPVKDALLEEIRRFSGSELVWKPRIVQKEEDFFDVYMVAYDRQTKHPLGIRKGSGPVGLGGELASDVVQTIQELYEEAAQGPVLKLENLRLL